MTRKQKTDIWILVIGFVVFLIVMFGIEQERERCGAQGGVLVKGALGNYVCVERR